MTYSEVSAAPFTIWRHEKTCSLYVVTGVEYCSTNGREEEKSIGYVSCTTGIKHYREVSEFLDGRFQPVGFRLEEVMPKDICPKGDANKVEGSKRTIKDLDTMDVGNAGQGEKSED